MSGADGLAVETAERSTGSGGPVLEAKGLVKHYPVRAGFFRRQVGTVQAVDGVDLEISEGATLGLVGESGSGKSTVARLLMQLVPRTAGTIRLNGREVAELEGPERKKELRNVQMVFQDPYSSFDPMTTIGKSIAEPLVTHFSLEADEKARRVATTLEQVGLSRTFADRRPSEMSGGQLQRAAIARALIIEPRLLVLDEPVSALDVSTQAQVINLLMDLQDEMRISLLFIAHDLAVVRHVSERIAVMYLGRIVEEGDAATVYEAPLHPYSAALLSAVPVPDPIVQRARERVVLQGDIPSPLNPPSGCRFRTRCTYVMPICSEVDPPAFVAGGSTVYCHLHTEGPQLGGETVLRLAGRSS